MGAGCIKSKRAGCCVCWADAALGCLLCCCSVRHAALKETHARGRKDPFNNPWKAGSHEPQRASPRVFPGWERFWMRSCHPLWKEQFLNGPVCCFRQPIHPGPDGGRKNGKQANCQGFTRLPRLTAAPPALASLFLSWSRYPLDSGLLGGTVVAVRPPYSHLSCLFTLQPSLQPPAPEGVSFPGAFWAPGAPPACCGAGPSAGG